MAIWRHQLSDAPVRRGKIWLLFAGVMLGVSVVFSTIQSTAGTTQIYWTDNQSGLAIGGYDPVAYFVDQRARAGTAKFELVWSGSTWRFASQGNREIFRRDPKVYAPQFGGYDPLQVARGFITPGNPFAWVIRQQRLYFFETRSQRDQWPKDDALIQSRAQENWPGLLHNLVK